MTVKYKPRFYTALQMSALKTTIRNDVDVTVDYYVWNPANIPDAEVCDPDVELKRVTRLDTNEDITASITEDEQAELIKLGFEKLVG